MKKFIRLGEKLSKIYVNGVDIEEFSIVVHGENGRMAPTDLTSPQYKAAEAFRRYVALVSGVTLPIVYDVYPVISEHKIIIGDIEGGKKQDFKPDEYSIEIKDGVSINGGKRGILYGVYAFIEKFFCVRFITDVIEKRIDLDEIKIGEYVERYWPVFGYREICDWTAWTPDFSVKHGINGNFVRHLRREDGGGVGFAGGFAGLVHTFGRFLPQSLYAEHPEYFALNESGVRDPSGICFSDKGAFDAVLRGVIDWLDKEDDPTIVSVSINDGLVAFCQCEKCRKFRENGANLTDSVLDFVNRIADAVAEKYPGVLVDTISYGAAALMPEYVKPRDNVIIRVCVSGTREFPLEESAEIYAKTKDETLKSSAACVERVKKYAELCNNIYVWTYPYNYYILNTIFPVFHTFLRNMRFYADNSAKGVFVNGETEACEFTELKVYLLAKVLFNPYMTEAEYAGHMDDFLECYYGEGYEYIRNFIEISLKEAQGTRFFSVEPQKIIPKKKNADGSYDFSFINRAYALFDKALERAADDSERRRIIKSRVQVDFYYQYCYMDELMAQADEKTRDGLIEKNKELYRNIVKFGTPRIVENTFLPVVKNFAQSPVEWTLWDFKATVGDRNNERYARELYVLLPCGQPKGEMVKAEFMLQTNNENEEGKLSVYGGENNRVYVPSYSDYRKYGKIELNGRVTDKADFIAESGIPPQDIRVNLLPVHLKGLILKIEKMDAGAYVMIKDICARKA